MSKTFYNVKKKQKVQIDEDSITKKVYTRTTKEGKQQTRYAFRAVDDDGTKLTSFCSEQDFNASIAPIVD